MAGTLGVTVQEFPSQCWIKGDGGLLAVPTAQQSFDATQVTLAAVPRVDESTTVHPLPSQCSKDVPTAQQSFDATHATPPRVVLPFGPFGASTTSHELGRRGTGGTKTGSATLEMMKIVETEKRIRADSSR